MGRRMLLILLVLIAAGFPVQAERSGTLVHLTPDKPLCQRFPIEVAGDYTVSVWLRGSRNQSAEMTMIVRLFSTTGQELGFMQMARGLGRSGDWHRMSMTVAASEQVSALEVNLRPDRADDYWWDELAVIRQDYSGDEIRQHWEKKIRDYGTVYTGLVIDARGLDVNRSMSPRVLSESGQLIYGGVTASMSFVQERGVVSYGHELTPDLIERIQVDSSYAYALPLILQAVDVVGPGRTDLVVSDQAAKRIFAALAAYDFLARYAVVFLVD